MAASIDLSIGGAHRCVGALAAAVVIGNSVSARERFHVEGCQSISVRTIGTTVTSDPVVQVVPQDPTVDDDDGSTADVGTGLTAATAIVADTENLHEYTLKGERYVDVVVTSDSGDAVTITSIDVYVKRQ